MKRYLSAQGSYTMRSVEESNVCNLTFLFIRTQFLQLEHATYMS
uniref:Uncharacterized protein n=1 Tax=Rhizophora mucronata TaxID=61149 RepID=A0A2P2R509_RHIMU